MLEFSVRQKAKRDIRLVSIFHASKPNDMLDALTKLSGGDTVTKLKEGQELSGMMRFAMAMGTAEDVGRIQDAQNKLNRRNKLLRFIGKREPHMEN